MGLDMYLLAERGRSYTNKEGYEGDFAPDYLGMKPQTVSYEMAYWRKHNRVHNWFAENLGASDETSRRVYVDEDDLARIIEACSKHSTTNDTLPGVYGFFFGDSEAAYTEEERAYDIESFTKALNFYEDTGEGYFHSIYYEASW